MYAKMLFRLFVAQVLLIVCSATADIRYVRPADSPLSSCPGQPCLTLHEYVEIDSFTNGTTLQFLPGNHTLQQYFSLVNISDVTLEAAFNHSVTNIICKNNVTIYCDRIINLRIIGLSFILSQRYNLSALEFIQCKSVFISDTIFQGSGEITGRAIRVENSEATISSCVFKGLDVTSHEDGDATSRCAFEGLSLRGPAICSIGTNLSIHESLFINNSAGDSGGAIYAHESSLLLNKTFYHGNSALRHGGAISCSWESQVDMVGNNTFHNNSCQGAGGAMYFIFSQLNMYGIAHFHFNEAESGGAIFLMVSKILFSGSVTMMKNRAAIKGGALHIDSIADDSYEIRNVKRLTLLDNAAGDEGGAMYIEKGYVTLGGNVTIESNTANMGGGIRAVESHINVTGDCILAWNNATFGGAMSTLNGVVHLQGHTQFTHNTAGEDGGAMLAEGTEIQILLEVNFDFNSAKNGGAMFFKSRASIILSNCNHGPVLITSFNSARELGGVIYYRDNPTISQCSYRFRADYNRLFPNCFLQFQDYSHLYSAIIVSRNDSAERDGNFMFGGLMDRCKFLYHHSHHINIFGNAIFIYPGSRPTAKDISSDPYSLCLCTKVSHNSLSIRSKFNVLQVEVFRGQKFTVPLRAKTQYGNISTIVTTITSSTARLETYQTSQPLPGYCHPLPYTVYSNKSHEQLVLYLDGPCKDTGTARVVINVTLLPCPDGFTQSGEICTCDDRLHDYPINCTIADTPYLTKTAGLDFWMGVSYVNTTYQGLVLCKSCPAEYCKKGAVNVNLDNPDMQCDLNRTGLLCGACAANHSLMLGSSQCQICPNTYLALLLPFAAAGVALVVFLTSLRITVATGILNSVILYANILQVKRSLFFPQNTINLLTVFQAWVNLDLGFQTCFYDGLDAYALTWLQFAFPIYVWLIIGLMIFVSRYSITVSKLIGSNPVAVLATLLLMSYTKILKIIIEIYSYENLEYPDNKTVSVWFMDANVPFLESKHLFLTVVTSLVLVFLFLPYTLLLLLGHKLYRFTGKKHWHWMNRLKPLLDSYYAPYNNHTRYWTGFLLLVRCALYIVFSISGPSISLATITLTFTVSGAIVGFLRIYKSIFINLIEACVYLNLVVLSAVIQTRFNTAGLIYSLVGLVFVVMIALIAYQFHLLYIAKTTLWVRLKNKWPRFRKQQSELQTSDDTINPPHDPHKIVTKTVIELREPLLDS